MKCRTWAVRTATFAAATLALTGLTGVVSAPAHAGQVGVTVSITGAGVVYVVEGTVADGASGACDARANVADPNATKTCDRIRSEATFEAWLWLRPIPFSDETGTWSVADGGWQGCDQVRSREGRTECGVHSDAFGSAERSPSIRFVDTVAPTVTWVLSTVSVAEDRTAIFSFGANEPGTLRCRFDDEAGFQPCTSPLKRTFGTDGPKKLDVFSTDRSGNAGPVNSTTAVLVDTTLTRTPEAVSNSRTASFDFVSGGGTSFSCSLDTRKESPCGSGRAGTWEVQGLEEGQHTVRVWAHNGTVSDPVPATHTWTVDTTAPQTVITNATSAGRTASFSISSPGASRIECRLSRDGSADPWTPCADPVTFQDLPDAAYVLEVRGVDAAGNADATPASHAWTVRTPPDDAEVPPPPAPDTTAPETTLTAGPVDGTFVLSDHVSVGFASSEPGGSWRCTLDGVARPCAGGGAELTGLAAGTHRFTVAAVDAAGNADASPASRTWTVPLTSSALQRGKGWKQKRATTAWGGSAAVSSRRGARLSTAVTGARAVALVATTGKRMGTVRVYAGKRLLGTVRLTGRRTTSRQVLPVATLPTPYTGKLRVVVASRGKPVRIEGLGVAS